MVRSLLPRPHCRLYSPVAEEPNLAMSGNNRFSAFFSSLYHVVQESVGCTDFQPLAFSEFKMASKMAAIA